MFKWLLGLYLIGLIVVIHRMWLKYFMSNNEERISHSVQPDYKVMLHYI